MKFLFLDDEPARHEAFAEANPDAMIWHAYNLDQFKRQLRSCEKFDVISFDFDLGPGPNGHDCAAHLIENIPPVQWPSVARVHSLNEPGARAIMATLRDAGIPTHRTSWWRK